MWLFKKGETRGYSHHNFVLQENSVQRIESTFLVSPKNTDPKRRNWRTARNRFEKDRTPGDHEIKKEKSPTLLKRETKEGGRANGPREQIIHQDSALQNREGEGTRTSAPSKIYKTFLEKKKKKETLFFLKSIRREREKDLSKVFEQRTPFSILSSGVKQN